MGVALNPVFRSLPLVIPDRVREWLEGANTQESSSADDYGTLEGDSLQDPQIARQYAEEAHRA
jgi:hypothetical protein